MGIIPKVKTTKVMAQVGTGITQDKLCPRGEFNPCILPTGGFNTVWNFKNVQPHDYFTRKQTPTTGGGSKVY